MAADTPKYFVKFLPYNQRTVSSLINKQIWFSKVYQFNDFTELNIIGATSQLTKELSELIYNHLNDLSFKTDILEHFHIQGYPKEFTVKFIKDLQELHNSVLLLNREYAQAILEWVAYYSVGIFSLSDLAVFEDDAAMLMLAHYAGNLSGLACIYEIATDKKNCFKKTKNPEILFTKDKSEPIDINNRNLLISRCSTSQFHERVVEWSAGNYSQVDNFLRKSKKWDYESEWRLFSNPGIKDATEAGAILRGILYTSRFNSTENETLTKINNHFYESNLFLAELSPSFTEYRFDVNKPGQDKSAFKWICDALEIENKT